MEREGSIFLGLEKYLHASPPMRSFSFFFSTCRLAAPRRSLVSSVSAIPSPYSEVSTVCSDFRALLFFPSHTLFFPPLSLYLCFSLFLFVRWRSGQRASGNMNPSSRLHCLGPVFATGTHRRKPVRTLESAHACACVRLFARRW